jgi:hypothetical protein
VFAIFGREEIGEGGSQPKIAAARVFLVERKKSEKFRDAYRRNNAIRKPSRQRPSKVFGHEGSNYIVYVSF